MSNELSKPSDAQLPAFMQEEEVLGTESLDRFVRPPRLKIVQGMSKPPYTSFAKGTTLLVPQMVPFAGMTDNPTVGESFFFVPIFFYPEWIQTNPLGKSPFVRDRSMDPRSELAKKANNKETWVEPHPDDPSMKVTNSEVLNFIVMPYHGHPMEGTPCVMNFRKATYRDGSNLASMIKLRRAPIFGQVFEAHTVEQTNDKGVWNAFEISIPGPEQQFVSEDHYAAFKQAHLDLAKAHEEGALQVDYEDPAEESADDDSAEF